jgi:ribose-phosphate pyrophosphokinase
MMELLIMVDAFRRASAGRITAVVPYFGYARQDRKAKARDPISAKLVADIIDSAGADRVLTMDLHAPQIQGFFDIPVDHLLGNALLVPYFLKKFPGRLKDDVVVVSPDLGSVTRARRFAERFDAPLAIIDKRRPKANAVEIMNVIGDVAGRTAVLVDDMIDTAGTLTQAAKALIEIGGASRVLAGATHAVLSPPAVERINESPIEEVVVLDTIPLDACNLSPKLIQLTAAGVFADAIERIYEDKPVSPLFM